MTGPRTTPTTPRNLTLNQIGRSVPWSFNYEPDAQAKTDISERLGLLGLKKVRLHGTLIAEGTRDWRLNAQLGATAVQPCSVSLAPVTTRIDAPVARLFTEKYADPDETESETPDDDSQEPLPQSLDLAELLAEALALELPDFPRAKDADFSDTAVAPPGAEPLTDADLNPFQALAALKAPSEGQT